MKTHKNQHKIKLVLSLLLALSVVPSYAAKPVAQASSGATYVTVNGKQVPAIYEAVFLNEQKMRGAQDSPDLRIAIKDEIVRRTVLSEEAKKKGLDKTPEVAAQMDLAAQAVLIRSFVGDYAKTAKVSEADVQQEYERVKSAAGSVEYQVQHILVKSEDEAKEIIKKIKAGESFAKLASSLSIDDGSKEKGGELGWNVAASFVAPFAEEMKRLAIGKYSETPVKTEFGYHVVQVNDKRNATPPPLEDVKPGIEKKLMEAKLNDYIDSLLKKAKIQ